MSLKDGKWEQIIFDECDCHPTEDTLEMKIEFEAYQQQAIGRLNYLEREHKAEQSGYHTQMMLAAQAEAEEAQEEFERNQL